MDKTNYIVQRDRRTNKIIKEWPTLLRASRRLGIKACYIRKCLEGIYSHAGGFDWTHMPAQLSKPVIK